MWFQLFRPEGHDHVEEYAVGGDAGNFSLIGIMHYYLVVTSVCIQETHLGMTRSKVHQLINFWTSLVKACEVNADFSLANFLLYHDCIGWLTRVTNLRYCICLF